MLIFNIIKKSSFYSLLFNIIYLLNNKFNVIQYKNLIIILYFSILVKFPKQVILNKYIYGSWLFYLILINFNSNEYYITNQYIDNFTNYAINIVYLFIRSNILLLIPYQNIYNYNIIFKNNNIYHNFYKFLILNYYFLINIISISYITRIITFNPYINNNRYQNENYKLFDISVEFFIKLNHNLLLLKNNSLNNSKKFNILLNQSFITLPILIYLQQNNYFQNEFISFNCSIYNLVLYFIYK